MDKVRYRKCVIRIVRYRKCVIRIVRYRKCVIKIIKTRWVPSLKYWLVSEAGLS